MDNNTWKIVDAIKRGLIVYNVDDVVTIFRRKSNGYPMNIKDNVEYTIRNVYFDTIYVATHSLDGIGWNSPIKVHKTYMISKNDLREFKLNKILDEQNNLLLYK